MKPQLIEGSLLPCTVIKSRTQDDCYVVMVLNTEYIGLLPREESQFQYYQGSTLWAVLKKMQGWKNLFTQKSEQYVQQILKGVYSDTPVRILKVAGVHNTGFYKVLVSCEGVSDKKAVLHECFKKIDKLRRYMSEKITFVPMSLDVEEQIVNALLPGQPEDVKRVILLHDENRALVYVEPHRKAIFLGKAGLNAATAAKLTGWRIEIL